MLAHDNGPGHPECADRLRVIRLAVDQGGFEHVRWVAPSAAANEEILVAHTAEHVEMLAGLEGMRSLLDVDTVVSPGSHEAARLAAGAALDAVAALMTGEAANAFAFVRPPGHHACADRAMGFCLFNNIAIAAADAVRRHGCRRVLVIDWDVHHGNGTQDILYERPDVLFISTHQRPLYPDTGAVGEIGAGAGRGYTVNLPLPPGQTDADYLALFRRIVVPIAHSYEPELVLVSAGFDAHARDPLADMRLSAEGFAALLAEVRDIAERHAKGRLALILEGGYDLRSLAHSVNACVAGLAPPRIQPDGSAQMDLSAAHEDLARSHAAHWPCLLP
ncbi:MAG: histone deacetylase [Planctomycetes bacterium]|nr:histone deacetylase [Planctomycetota bacterium]